MSKRPLTIAFDYDDHVADLANGRVPPSRIFYRFLQFHEFDASEVSFAKYVSMRATGDDSLRAIPADELFPPQVRSRSKR